MGVGCATRRAGVYQHIFMHPVIFSGLTCVTCQVGKIRLRQWGGTYYILYTLLCAHRFLINGARLLSVVCRLSGFVLDV